MSDPSLPPEIGPDDLPSSPPEPGPTAPGTSRRWFLAGGAAVLLGGGAGVLAEVLHEGSPTPASPAPAALVSAVDAERALIAALDAMPAGAHRSRAVVAQIRADHAAHLHALRRLLATYPQPAKTPGHPGFVQPRTLGQLRGVETHAARDAAQRAAALDGAAAALLASIAACEATHAELLR